MLLLVELFVRNINRNLTIVVRDYFKIPSPSMSIFPQLAPENEAAIIPFITSQFFLFLITVANINIILDSHKHLRNC